MKKATIALKDGSYTNFAFDDMIDEDGLYSFYTLPELKFIGAVNKDEMKTIHVSELPCDIPEEK
jgi:hypothetical protein